MLKFGALYLAVLITSAGAAPISGSAGATWSVDAAGSAITLSASQPFSRLTATLPIASGTIVAQSTDPVPEHVQLLMDSASLTTHNAQQDALLHNQFFDVARYPSIEFVSRRITETAPGTFAIDGTLTMHGTSHPLVLTARLSGVSADPASGKRRARFTATGSFQRSDYGITYLRGIVGNTVTLNVVIDALS